MRGRRRAPRDPETIAWYYENGIPDGGSYKAMPVPGAVHLCFTALKLYGTKSFEEAVAPTLALLDAGEPAWHPALASTLRKMVERERETQGTREEKLDAARDRFYKGDIADDLVRWYESVGSPLRKADLEAHVTVIEDPVSIEYRGYTVHKCSTWTQGPALCQTLQLLEGYDLKSMGHLSADYIHLVVPLLGTLEELLPRPVLSYSLVSSHTILFDGSMESFMVFYNPEPEENRLPPRIDQPCQ